MLLTSFLSVLPMNASAYTVRGYIYIDGNSDFISNPAVTGGAGTAGSPWIIEGWQITDSFATIMILDTTDYFIIRGVSVSGGVWGIILFDVQNARVENSIIYGAEEAVDVENSFWVSITGNTISGGSFDSIGSYFSENVTLGSNSLETGINIWGDTPAHYDSHTISADNTVNSLPIKYYKKSDNLVINGGNMAQLILASCDNARISNLDLDGGGVEILNGFCVNNTITDCVVSGGWVGIELDRSFDCAIVGNNVSGNDEGVYCFMTNETVISSNDAYNDSEYGIGLENCSFDSIVGNNIGNSTLGVQLLSSTGTSVYANDFSYNAVQAKDDEGTENSWDAGPQIGGNYWSNYGGIDTNMDGKGDTIFVIDSNSRDFYPLMLPHTNAAPVARLYADHLIRNSSGSFVLSVKSSTDLEDPARILEVRWDWEKDGTWDTNWSSVQTVVHQYTSEGNHTVCAEIRDSEGLTNKTTVTLTVDDTPPTMVFITQAGHVFTKKEAFINWSCSDNMTGVGLMEYSLDGGSFIKVMNESITLLNLTDGTHTIKLRATDGAGNIATENLTFKVDTNILSPSGPMGALPLILIIAAIAAVIVAIVLVMRWKKKIAPIAQSPQEMVTPQPVILSQPPVTPPQPPYTP
jgi:parallel beta-helix repeat protein